MRSRIILGFVAAGLLILGAFSPVAAEELYIGCVLDFSADTAFFDVPNYEGIKLAVEELNAAGGIGGKYKIKLAAKDFRNDATEAVSTTKALLDDGAHVIIGPTSTMLAITVGKQARERKIPTVYPLASPPFITKEVGPFGFLVTFGDNLQAAVIAKYASELGLKAAYLMPSLTIHTRISSPNIFPRNSKSGGARLWGRQRGLLPRPNLQLKPVKLKSTGLNPT